MAEFYYAHVNAMFAFKYEEELRRFVESASPEALRVCLAWHGDRFGLPGHGSVAFVAEELSRAQKAVDVLTTKQGERMLWRSVERPGYFGRRRDEKIAAFDAKYGRDNWRLVWIVGDTVCEFVDACKQFYEESYFRWFKDHPEQVDFVCTFTNCIDNAPTNVDSGCDYTIQEAFSTHIQDIAVRNVLRRLGRWFTGDNGQLLVIRSRDDNGYRYGPGNIPFYAPELITQPSLCPPWAQRGSTEDAWQSCKWLQVRA